MAAYAPELMHSSELVAGAAERLLPPGRMKPSEAADRYLKNDKGDFDLSAAPMIAEPMDALAGRRYQGIVLVGPQRSTKTFGMVFGSLSWIVTCAPGDTKVVQMTQDTARMFSRREVDKVIRHSPALRDRLSPRAKDDNTYDKWFTSGMSLSLGWPSVTQLSSETLKYIIFTDYDRPENRDDVDGEGPMWDLGFKRVQTYMSRGKCIAESSPGSDVMVPDWRPDESEPHGAPPTRGILAIYNNGTRAQWYWPCWHCGDLFRVVPGFQLFGFPSFDKLQQLVQERDIEDLVEEYARVVCPLCGGVLEQHHKPAMNAAGCWVHEGQRVQGDRVSGEPRRSNIWSGWLGGVAASYQRWDSMVRNMMQAVATYVRSGDESPMRLVTTSDGGAPYTPRLIQNQRTAEALVERAEIWTKGECPEGVRFLTMAVDVQAHRFVVQVHGWGVGLEQWLIDRYDISQSRRREGSDGERFAALSPGSYPEDWHQILPAVRRMYPVADLDVELPVLFCLIDSGGRAGVTANAYAFWRRLKSPEIGLHERIQLIRGVGRPEAPRIKKTWPDQRKRKDRKQSTARGDVLVWQINTDTFKDTVAGALARAVPGPRYMHLPDWLNRENPQVFDELVAEVKTDKGWRNLSGKPNEGTDLASYNYAACVAIGGERIDWANPPAWAAPPEQQTQLRKRGQAQRRRRRVVNSGVKI